MLLDTHQRKIRIASPTIPTKEPRRKIKRKQGVESTPKVRFSPRVLGREIPHLNNMSEQQIQTLWYTKEGYSDIKSEIKLTLKRQNYGVVLELDTCEELCFRGLEALTKEGNVLRKINQLSGIEAVLHEQSRQILLGMYSSDDVAQVYNNTVYRARRAAHIKGLSDAREASGRSIKEEIQEAKTEKSTRIKLSNFTPLNSEISTRNELSSQARHPHAAILLPWTPRG